MARLVVTADDLGYSAVRDGGILEAFTAGIVTRASLMVNGSSATSAARRALDAGLPVGLHLNVTEGGAVADPPPASLVDDRGCFLGPPTLAKRAREGLLVIQDLEREIEAQASRFALLVGHMPRHVDGHNHAHVLAPVAEALAAVMNRLAIPEVRVPDEACFSSTFLDALPPGKEDFYRGVARDAQRAFADHYAKRGIARSSQAFVGMGLMGRFLTRQTLCDALLALPSSVHSVELMVHPGQRCIGDEAAEGCWRGKPDEFSMSVEREMELETLTDPELREVLQRDLGFALCAYATALLHREEKEAAPRTSKVSVRAKNRSVALDTTKMKPRRGCVALLLSTTLGTGNLYTGRRIASLLSAAGYETLILNTHAMQRVAHVRHVLERHGASVVLGINAKRVGCLGTSLSGDAGRRFFVITGGTDINGALDDESVVEIFRRCAGIVSFNVEMRDALAPLRVAPVTVIPQAVDVSAVAQSSWSVRASCGVAEDARLMLLVCGLRKVKAPSYLRAAWAQVRQRVPRATLIVIGPTLDDTVASELDEWIAEEEEGSVIRHGMVPRANLLRAIANADVLINTSESEGMSGAILEAMALETPVLARRNAGNQVLIREGKTGLLFDSPEDFVRQAARLFGDPELRASIVRGAATVVKAEYSPEAEQRAYVELLTK